MYCLDKPITIHDITALEKIIDLVKNFSDKNPIRKEKINYEQMRKELNQIKPAETFDYKVFNKVLKRIRAIITQEVHSDLFLISGGHGGIIIEDKGFCEFDSPKFAIQRLLDKMNLALETSMPYNLEIAMSCLEWLNRHYPETIAEFKRLFQRGRFEIINPTYSQPYNLIIGPESNIKQFEYGLRVLKQLGLDCNLYYCSEVSLHPQIPQILKGFNLNFGSLRTRLLGIAPTTSSGHILWKGLDNTLIETITDQAGIFNGEYWHGTFFREIPNLLFQAVGRPFMEHIIYSSIEDFVMPLAYQAEIWRISRFLEVFGKFILCSELFQLTASDGEFQFSRDDFALGGYIFIPSDLFLHNKECETALICAEILNCILGFFSEESNDSLFEELWPKLLLTQAHDNYAVPFMRTGDYSAQQLSAEELKHIELPATKVAISEVSKQIQKEVQTRCRNFIDESLGKLAGHLGANSMDTSDATTFLIFNPTAIAKRDIVSIPVKLENPSRLTLMGNTGRLTFQYEDSTLKFIPEIPPLGYGLYSLSPQDTPHSEKKGTFFYTVELSVDSKGIEIKFNAMRVYELKFESSYDYKLSLTEHHKDSIEDKYIVRGKIQDKDFQLEIVQYEGVNRLEFLLESALLKAIILSPAIPVAKTLINYPFGIEETKRSNIQTLDFLWLAGEAKGIIFMIKNSQRFVINRANFTIRNLINPTGRFEFAIAITTEHAFDSVSGFYTAFQFKLVGIPIQGQANFLKRSDSFLSLTTPITLINLWRRQKQSFLRVFNPSNSEQSIGIKGVLLKHQLKEIDFNYNPARDSPNTQEKIGPWKIKTYEI